MARLRQFSHYWRMLVSALRRRSAIFAANAKSSRSTARTSGSQPRSSVRASDANVVSRMDADSTRRPGLRTRTTHAETSAVTAESSSTLSGAGEGPPSCPAERNRTSTTRRSTFATASMPSASVASAPIQGVAKPLEASGAVTISPSSASTRASTKPASRRTSLAASNACAYAPGGAAAERSAAPASTAPSDGPDRDAQPAATLAASSAALAA